MVLEVLTAEQMRRADRLTIESGIPGFSLMTAAGKAVASVARERYPQRRFLVLCGPGNNGGDGFIAAAVLARNKVPVRVACLVDRHALTGDAARAASEWKGEILPFEGLSIDCAEIVIDAVFGLGFSRRLQRPVTDIFQRIKEQNNLVIAVDTVSGLNSDTGEFDPAALVAQTTVTFFRKKIGHVLMPGLALSGDVVVADIGIADDVLEATGFVARENGPALWRPFLKPKTWADNKYTHGYVLIGGGARLTGAAGLAGMAALRVGTGLCTIAAPSDVANVYRSYDPGLMVEVREKWAAFGNHLHDDRRNAVLMGPGAGLDDVRGLKRAVIDSVRSGRACVLDADALTVFVDDRQSLFRHLHGRCVLTPHEGEFARIFPGLAGLKTVRAAAAARLSGAVVVLKGADTVIAAPEDGRLIVNTHTSPWLATGGTGDVLAGMIAGLLAGGLPTVEATAAAVWMQGEAARRLGPGLIASDMPGVLPAVLVGLLG